jgi:hypothetical protein
MADKKHSLRELRLRQERLIERAYREMDMDDLARQFRRHRVIKQMKPKYIRRAADE